MKQEKYKVGDTVKLCREFAGFSKNTLVKIRAIDSDGDLFFETLDGKWLDGYLSPSAVTLSEYHLFVLDVLNRCLSPEKMSELKNTANLENMLMPDDLVKHIVMSHPDPLSAILSFHRDVPAIGIIRVGSVVTVTKNSNGHNYDVGKQYRVSHLMDDRTFHAVDEVSGKEGNILSQDDVELVRQGGDELRNKFLASIDTMLAQIIRAIDEEELVSISENKIRSLALERLEQIAAMRK